MSRTRKNERPLYFSSQQQRLTVPGVVRDNDANTAGGRAQSRVTNVLVNNRRICVNGSSVTSHPPPPHSSARTSNGIRNVLANNIPINVRGNQDTCGHARSASSSDVIAG